MEESHQNIEAYLKCNFEFALLSEMFSLSLSDFCNFGVTFVTIQLYSKAPR